MSINTKNFNFIKPELTDAADITNTNRNWDILDAKLKEMNDEVTPVAKGGTGVTNLNDFYAKQAYHLAPNNCSNTDFNTLKKAGYYFGYTGMANAAFNEICVLEVIPYSNDWVLQRQTRLTDGKMFYRYFKEGSTWGEWRYIYTSNINDTAKFEYGSYSGGGSKTKTIGCSFVPKFLVVMQDRDANNPTYHGMMISVVASKNGTSILTDETACISVTTSTTTTTTITLSGTQNHHAMNSSGYSYHWIALG